MRQPNDEWLQADARTPANQSQEDCRSTKQTETRCWERTAFVPEGAQPIDIINAYPFEFSFSPFHAGQMGVNKHIVTLTEHPLTVQEEITPQVLAEMGLTCLHAPVVDQYPPDEATVQETVRFVDQMKAQGQPVLFHCHAGVGRTGTMLHAYYLAEGLSLEEAKAKVKAEKPTSQFIMLSPAQKEFLEEFAESIQQGEPTNFLERFWTRHLDRYITHRDAGHLYAFTFCIRN